MLEVILSFGLSFLLTFISIPVVIKVAELLGLVDYPDERKSHIKITPSFGGIGIFIGFLLVIMLVSPMEHLDQFRYILASLLVVFIVGAKDDMDPISPLKKLGGQVLAISLLIFLADIRISSLYGVLGVEELPYALSVVITMVFFVFLINSFNLIDGINGLASSITILASAVLGSWFFLVGQEAYCIFAFAVTGSTLAFLYFNITPARIFMGDTGSLILGTACSIMAIHFLESNALMSGGAYYLEAAPALALSIFILPAFDTIRVFVLRLSKGKSPFLPDKNHIHHLLLDFGLTHMQATATLLVSNLAFMILAINLQSINQLVLMLTLLSLAFVSTQTLSIAVYSKKKGFIRSS